jgi:hypothetical protein
MGKSARSYSKLLDKRRPSSHVSTIAGTLGTGRRITWGDRGVIFSLLLTFALQPAVGAEAVQAPRISAEIFSLHPYNRGAYSCSKGISRQQGRIFHRRFSRRIKVIERKDAALFGPDPGFETVGIGHCTRGGKVWSTLFANALRQFDKDLALLEARYR